MKKVKRMTRLNLINLHRDKLKVPQALSSKQQHLISNNRLKRRRREPSL